jgi:hypothetical protein
MAESAKVRENRLRRMAHRQGFRVTKSRRRDHRARDYGTFWLVGKGYLTADDDYFIPADETISEPRPIGFTIDELEEALTKGVT